VIRELCAAQLLDLDSSLCCAFRFIFTTMFFDGKITVQVTYSTTNKMHLLSQIIYSCKTLYMFWSFRPSSGAQNCLYSNGICQNSCCHLPQQVAAAVCTGHNTLRRHLYIMGLCNDSMCRKFGTEEETSVHILCECGFSLTQACLSGLLLLDAEDIRGQGTGAIWNFAKGTGLL
jgi:hypothetical protein